jgi:hypothetical protein
MHVLSKKRGSPELDVDIPCSPPSAAHTQTPAQRPVETYPVSRARTTHSVLPPPGPQPPIPPQAGVRSYFTQIPNLPDVPPGVRIASLGDEHFNSPLGPADLEDIRDVAASVESRYLYSTMATPLALCRRVREDAGPVVAGAFAAALGRFTPSAQSVLETYGGGTCFSLAPTTCRLLQDRLGLHACLVAEYKQLNVLTMWPSPHSAEGRGAFFQGAADHMRDITHLDVVVPAFTHTGDRQMVHVPSGLGIAALPEKLKSLAVEAFHSVTAPAADQLDARSVSTLHKICMVHPDGLVFGLDLLRAHVYVNRALANRAGSMRTFSFSEIRSTLQGNSVTDPFMTMLDYVRQQFELPRGFVHDVAFLIRHHDAYVDEVLLPRARTLTLCVDVMLEAQEMHETYITLLDGIDDAIRHPLEAPLGRGKEAIAAATQCVEQEDGQTAAAFYREALSHLQECRQGLCRVVLEIARNRPQSLLDLDRDAMSRLPHDFLQQLVAAVTTALPPAAASDFFYAWGPKLLRLIDISEPAVVMAVKRWEAVLLRKIDTWQPRANT